MPANQPPRQRSPRDAATTTVALLVVTVALLGPSAGAQTEPAAPTTAAPATTAPADPNAPAVPNAPTTVKPVVTKLPPARRAPSKDPAVLEADGRNAAGVIVATSPILDAVPITSERYDGAAQQRDADAADLADANHRVTTSERRLDQLESDRTALVELIGRTTERRRKLGTAASELHGTLRAVAISRFVNGSTDEAYPDPNQTIEEQLELSHRRTIAGQAEQQVEQHAVGVEGRIATADAEITDWRRQQTDNEDETAATTKALTKARSDADIATAAVVGAEEELRLARPMTVVTGSDLPLVALDAYWRAANDLAATRSTCHLRWWGLAGIGRSESNHGRATGGQAGPDGTVSVPVFGPPLDGTNGTRVLADTDKGVLDLDPNGDRAVGVMQFLPGTWKRYAEDESGDRTADPQNLYDAALAAGKLLCTTSGGLDTDEGLRKAYFAYNHSDDYVETVLQRAHDYETLPVPAPPTE